MGLKAQKIKVKLSNRIKDSKEFSKFFRVLGTLTEMTKKMVNCSKNIPGHFQDKTVKIVNSRTNSKTKKKFQDISRFSRMHGHPVLGVCHIIVAITLHLHKVLYKAIVEKHNKLSFN